LSSQEAAHIFDEANETKFPRVLGKKEAFIKSSHLARIGLSPLLFPQLILHSGNNSLILCFCRRGRTEVISLFSRFQIVICSIFGEISAIIGSEKKKLIL